MSLVWLVQGFESHNLLKMGGGGSTNCPYMQGFGYHKGQLKWVPLYMPEVSNYFHMTLCCMTLCESSLNSNVSLRNSGSIKAI